MRLIKRRSSSSLGRNRSEVSLSADEAEVPPLPITPTTTDGSVALESRRKKRDSTETKYPPTSFVQPQQGTGAGPSSSSGSGWSFGRMRSFKGRDKGKGRAREDQSDTDNLELKGTSNSNSRSKSRTASRESLRYDTPSHPASTRTTPSHPSSPTKPPPLPLVMPSSPPDSHTIPLATDRYPLLPQTSPEAHRVTRSVMAVTPKMPHTAPVIALGIDAPSDLKLLVSARRPPLNTTISNSSSSPSYTPSFTSGDSSVPLVPRADDGQPRRRTTAPGSASSPRKLTKRRPVSVIYDSVELQERPSTSASASSDRHRAHARSSSAHARPTQIFTVMNAPVPYRPPVMSQTLPLPDGAAPPSQQFNWSLNRNPSSSTAASSGMTPSTDESGMLETPNNAVLITGMDGEIAPMWEQLRPSPALSRASTLSYQEGDDGTVIFKSEHHHTKHFPLDIPPPVQEVVTTRASRSRQNLPSGTPSPTQSTTLSTMTRSSGSDVTAKPSKSLRISTSNLELKTTSTRSQPESVNDIATESTPNSAKRKSITFDFESQPLAPEACDTPHPSTQSAPRAVRPPLNRIRSSSLGAMSINTNSVYSVGEVTTATNAVVTTARAVQLTTTTTQRVDGGGVSEILRSFESSSDAVRRAFDYERERGEWPLAFVSDGLPEDRQPAPATPSKGRRGYSARAAPLPPHLSPKTKHKKEQRPPLSPILRPSSSTSSPTKQVSFRSSDPPRPLADSDQLKATTPTDARPGMPVRSGSFSRLWRRLSSSGSLGKGKKGKQVSDDVREHEDEVPPVPQRPETPPRIKRSRGSLDLTSPLRLMAASSAPADKSQSAIASTHTLTVGAFDGTKDEHGVSHAATRPDTPSSIRSKKGKKKMPAIPPPHVHSAPLSGRSDTPPTLPPLSPTPPLQDPMTSPGFEPIDFTASPLPVEGDLPSLEAERSSAPVRSFRKLPSPPSSSGWLTPLGPYTPPLTAIVSDPLRDMDPSVLAALPDGAILSREVQLHRVSLHADAEMQSYDAKRRYRQSLVEIKDDEAFQATVEQFVRLESDGRVRMTRGGGAALRSFTVAGELIDAPPPMFRTPSKDVLEKQIRQENIRAWFVTRELVHGERRHGRLLARGVAAVQIAAKIRKTVPPPPPPRSPELADGHLPNHLPPAMSGHRRSGSGNIKTPLRFRRPRTSASASISGTVSDRLSPASTSTSMAIMLGPPPIPSPSPLDILLYRLPKLQALSIALSERFEHDPSPYGVADAFVAMEHAITEEVSGWASQVGEVVMSGLGGEINKLLEDGKGRRGRRVSEGSRGGGDEAEGEERLGFADIIIMPIQRASRYKLLFQELSTKLPPTSHTSLKIHRALEASTRLATACDRCQSFDLNALRRDDKKGKRARPVSVGPGMALG